MSVDFCKTYSQLINLSSDASPDSFYSTDDYSQLSSLGPTLPKLGYAFPKADNSKASESTVDVQLKSIRPPYKFSTTLKGVLTSQSVYKVKDLLISKEATLSQAGVTPSNLKFMIKSKVLTDTTLVASLAQEGAAVSITVMVSAPNPTQTTGQSDLRGADSAEPDPRDSVPLSLSSETWSKIQSLLAAEVGPENGAIFLEKFKSLV